MTRKSVSVRKNNHTPGAVTNVISFNPPERDRGRLHYPILQMRKLRLEEARRRKLVTEIKNLTGGGENQPFFLPESLPQAGSTRLGLTTSTRKPSVITPPPRRILGPSVGVRSQLASIFATASPSLALLSQVLVGYVSPPDGLRPHLKCGSSSPPGPGTVPESLRPGTCFQN